MVRPEHGRAEQRIGRSNSTLLLANEVRDPHMAIQREIKPLVDG
jgi:hypothetical protein